MAQKLTANDLGEIFHTDGKTIRKFLRDVTPEGKRPGRGQRWEIPATKTQLTRLNNQFRVWSEHHSRLLQTHSG